MCLFSCDNRESSSNKSEIGKYVYIDKDSTLHVVRKCTKFILEEKDPGIKRISSENIPPEYLDKCCSYCVDDEAYEMLEGKAGKLDKVQQHKLHPYE